MLTIVEIKVFLHWKALLQGLKIRKALRRDSDSFSYIFCLLRIFSSKK